MSQHSRGLERWVQFQPGTKKKIDSRNTLNELNGREWTYFIRSIILTTYPAEYGHELRREHYANKPPSLCKEFIEFFTKMGARVLDPFMGVGGTLVGASLCGREALGIEINEKWVETYNRVSNKCGLTRQQVVLGDCREELKKCDTESFDFVLTDPPYFYIASEKTSSDKTRLVERFSTEEKDIGNIIEYESFLDALEEVFCEIKRVLKKGKYAVFFMKNRYIKGKFYAISYDVARRAERSGLVWRGEHIWFNKGQKLFPFGYPYRYVVNTVHHNIEVLMKPS